MLEAVADTVRRVRPRGLSRPELNDLLTALDRIEAATAERRLAVLREIDALGDRGLPAAAVNRAISGRSQRKAEREADTAQKLGAMPKASHALSLGEISVEHVDTLARAAERTSPQHVDAELLDTAKKAPADLFAKRASTWATRHESAAKAHQRHARQRAERELVTWHDGGDTENGALHLHGRLDSATAKAFTVALQEKIDELWRADGGRDGSPNDVRTPGQRAIDALVELVVNGRASDTVTPRYMIHIIAHIGDPTPEHLDGSPVPTAVLEQLDEDTRAIGHVFDGTGQPLWLGRTRRLASGAQWLSRIAADRGCTDCGAGPERCQMHHAHEWEAGGPSNIDNFELKCHTHHALVHRGSRGDPKRWRRPQPDAA